MSFSIFNRVSSAALKSCLLILAIAISSHVSAEQNPDRDDICARSESLHAELASICSSAYFSGRWFPVNQGGVEYLTTTHGGSSLRFNVSGAQDVYLGLSVDKQTAAAPRISVYISRDAGELVRDRFIDLEPGEGVKTYNVLGSLDKGHKYGIEVRVVGVSQFDNRWENGGVIKVAGITATKGSAVTPWIDSRRKILFIGDSIVEGLAAKTSGKTQPENSAGDEAFGTIASNILNMSPINNGYGGVGLIMDGSGGWPAVPKSSEYYMRGVRVEGESPAAVVVMLGSNDFASEKDYRHAYKAYLKQLISNYPNSVIVAMIPFSQRYAAPTSDAAKSLGVPVISTDGWGISTTDGLHPDTSVTGHRLAGEKTAKALKTILGM